MARALVSQLCGAALLATALAASAQTSTTDLRAAFLNPPAAARPMVRWWWFGAAVTKEEIARELQQMSADGIGGAELAFVYPLQTTGNLPFTSPAMLDMVHFAETEGARLGLRIDITLCSGWPYGGPHITLANAATKLKISELPLASGDTSIKLPKLAEGDSFLYAAITDGTPKHWSSAHTEALPAPTNGTLHVTSASHDRVALIFLMSHTRQQVKRAAVGAEGFVLDPFSADAVSTHLNAVGKPLLSAFGKDKPYAIFSDSLEAYGADWTPTLPAEFKKRRGYDLLPHLPEILAGDTPEAQRTRHDYGRTLTELINENYLIQITKWAEANGTKFRSQTYGEPAVSFSSQRLVSLAEGEGPKWRAFSTLRWASSANHVFGNPVTSGESFTWLHSPVFRATPLDMKSEADVDFLSGENLLVFHGWPYSPPASELPAGDPGWSLYAAGAFNDHNPWHPVMPAVTSYISRISYLLRQGQPANQVALLLPTDDAWANFIPGKVTVTGAMSTLITPELMSSVLSSGYNLDFIDADAIQSTGLGTHQILLIPPTDRIPVATIKKLAEFTQHGGRVVVVGKLPTLDSEGNPLGAAAQQLASIASISAPDNLTAALHKASAPDFTLDAATDAPTRDAIGFVRRKLDKADIYFVANTSNRELHTTANFSSHFKTLTELDPDTGKTTHVTQAGPVELTLQPYASRVFYLSDDKAPHEPTNTSPQTPLTTLQGSWHLNLPAINKTFTSATPNDWSTHPEALHYSGEGIYTTSFNLDTLPKGHVALGINGGSPEGDEAPISEPQTPDAHNPLYTHTGPGMHAFYDAPVREAARLVVNGHDAGVLWHPPYRLDVTPFLKTGQNTIELHVFNTAFNAWSGIAPRDYTKLKEKYGDRFQMQDLAKVKPLPSGILGTVSLTVSEPQ